MANITKDKLKEIITNAPAGTDPQTVVKELLNRGHTLEGFDASRAEGVKKTETRKGVIEKVAGFLVPTATETVRKYQDGEDIGFRDIAGSALEIGSYLVPGGAAVKTGITGLRGIRALRLAGVGAASGGLMEAGGAIGEGDDLGGIARRTAVGAGVGGLLGAGIGGAPSLIRKGVEQLPTPSNIAEGFMQRAIPINPSDIRKISKGNSAGQSPAKWLLDRGIQGSPDTIITQLYDIGKNSKKTVDEGLARISLVYTGKEATSAKLAIKELRKTFAGTIGNEPMILKLKEFATKKGLTLTDMNNIKRLLDDNITIYKSNGDLRAGAVGKGLSNVRDQIKTFIENEAEKHGFAGVKQLNKDTQVSHQIRKAIASRQAGMSNNRAWGLTDIIVGVGAGASTLNPLVGIAAVAVKKIAENPKLQTKLAQAINRLGKKEIDAIENAVRTGTSNKQLEALINAVTRGTSGTRSTDLPAGSTRSKAFDYSGLRYIPEELNR